MFGFAFSKSIDDASQSTGASAGGYALAIDSRNLKLEHARSDFDRGHAFTAVFSHPIPAGSHRRYLSGRQGLTNAVLGNWQLAGAMTATSGQALTIMDSSVNTGIGGSNRPNRLAGGQWEKPPRADGVAWTARGTTFRRSCPQRAASAGPTAPPASTAA